MRQATTVIDQERRRALLGIKLSALVRDHLGEGVVALLADFGLGAALTVADQAWVLLDEQPGRGLGPALAWATGSVNVLADRETGQLARRAQFFDREINVWQIQERQLVPAQVQPIVEPAPVPPGHLRFRQLMEAAGIDPVVEHGVLVGEVEGLEVCRVVHDEPLNLDRVEVGVGVHDREAFQMMHGDIPTAHALARVAEFVRSRRSMVAPPHPIKQFAEERSLLARLRASPSIVGAQWLERSQPPVVRGGIKECWPAVGLGLSVDGDPMVVVTSVGIDLDVVPFAADARAALDDSAELVLVLPRRDAVRPTRRLAEALKSPARIVTV